MRPSTHIVKVSSVALAIFWYCPFLHPFILLTSNAGQRTFKRSVILSASQRLEPVSPPASPSYLAARDVSIVATTIRTGVDFVGALASWLANDPLEIIVVIIDDQVPLLNALVDQSFKGTEYSRATVTVLALPTAGKRNQIAHGLERVRGSITVLVDDDVFW